MGLIRIIKGGLYRSGVQHRLSSRRLEIMDRIACGKILGSASKKRRILEVGCANGKDFVTLVTDRDDLDIYGIDLVDKGLRQKNFTMIVGDAAQLDFPEDYFDVVLSFGVLEHVQPVEKLCRVISEISRVGKSYFNVVPAVSTLIEPHTSGVFWQLRGQGRKVPHKSLNYYSDDAWLQFEGFQDASMKRFFHIPPFITNLLVYRSH